MTITRTRITPELKQQMQDMTKDGQTPGAIATKLGVSQVTVRRHVLGVSLHQPKVVVRRKKAPTKEAVRAAHHRGYVGVWQGDKFHADPLYMDAHGQPLPGTQKTGSYREYLEPKKPETLTDREAVNAICDVLEPLDKGTRSRVLKAVHLVLNTLEAEEDVPKQVAHLRPTGPSNG